jgi:hypothetical protein
MQSPKLYNTKETISDLSNFKLDSDEDEYEVNSPDLNMIYPEIYSKCILEENIDYDHIIKIYPRISEDNKEYKSFLCELELFNFTYAHHDAYILYIKYDKIYNIYFNYLCNKLGNDITLFGSIFRKEKLKYFIEIEKYSKNNIIRVPININNEDSLLNKKSFLFKDLELIKERKNMNLPYEYLSIPFYIKQINVNEYDLYYSPEILNSDTMYAMIPVAIEYKDASHFCFIFVNHKNKKVEFYDPNGGSAEIDLTEFIYSALIHIFIDYDVDEFWKVIGIQNTEHLERHYSENYCVIWGTIMFHLKLLNPTMSLIELENIFLKECVEKKLAIYEVMLNYAYYITRIVPRNVKKLIKLDKTIQLNY